MPRRKRKLPHWVLPVKKLYHSRRIPDLCKMRYPGHPNGCPQYGKRAKCPPAAAYITDVLDINRPMWLAFSEFDLAAHVIEMKRRHPNWTERQCRNVLYWQQRSKKQMVERARWTLIHVGGDKVVTMGEAAGVNLYATCRDAGLKLKVMKEITICHHVAIIGYRKRRSQSR